MKIGNLEILNNILAAPLAGLTTRAFREICRAAGAGLAYGEMVSAQALCYGNKRTLELIDCEGEPGPRIIQLFGSDPYYLGQAAPLLKQLGVDLIDLNMGCPVPKVVRNGEGAALMRQPAKAAFLVEAVAKAGLPVTVKIRSGWDAQSCNAAELAKRLEAAGAALIAVHGRTRDQFYEGRADWQAIAEVKRAVKIPVAGNGDIWSAVDARLMLEQTGCDAVMVGRGMLGNPWLLGEIRALLAGGELPLRPSQAEVLALALCHLQRQTERYIYWQGKRKQDEPERIRLEGELAAVRSMRGHLGYYVKGMPGAAQLRFRINQLTRVQEIEALFHDYLTQQDWTEA